VIEERPQRQLLYQKSFLQPNPMTFTPEQIEFIEQIIDRRMIARLSARHSRSIQRKEYHTTREIRHLVLKHLPELRDQVKDREFPVSFLRFFLASKVIMRSKDTEPHAETGKSTTTRFDHQVGHAVQPATWKDSPFERARNGYYRIRPVLVVS
jgi:hypothetical protein